MDATQSAALRLTDRLFRVAGIVAVAALLVTIAMGLAGAEAWRTPFLAAHLAALVALLPLGVVLVVRAYREAGGLASMLARHPVIAIALAVVAVSVTVTLVAFSESPDVRRISNVVTVSIVVLLIARYLRWYARYATDSAGSGARSVEGA